MIEVTLQSITIIFVEMRGVLLYNIIMNIFLVFQIDKNQNTIRKRCNAVCFVLDHLYIYKIM
jgi:hypothetical protein